MNFSLKTVHLKILIQTSLNQIETANKLEEWEESFKTSEKIQNT